ISGCQRLCPVCGSSRSRFLRSISMLFMRCPPAKTQPASCTLVFLIRRVSPAYEASQSCRSPICETRSLTTPPQPPWPNCLGSHFLRTARGPRSGWRRWLERATPPGRARLHSPFCPPSTLTTASAPLASLLLRPKSGRPDLLREHISLFVL